MIREVHVEVGCGPGQGGYGVWRSATWGGSGTGIGKYKPRLWEVMAMVNWELVVLVMWVGGMGAEGCK